MDLIGEVGNQSKVMLFKDPTNSRIMIRLFPLHFELENRNGMYVGLINLSHVFAYLRDLILF